ncbi:hypothetical protein [Methylobacterium planeticum]|uniref:Uncharacterized protein n=1 Tax=Methylobacterium planeticum TaxID=2615211 RepID=A0A6N6MMS1_9HYPH|nr:hypothetical protein [Methylobacterium planeticum]KAB1071171.1 hypothetical protein F6X51_19950 [Methylobacterium planeticum]
MNGAQMATVARAQRPRQPATPMRGTIIEARTPEAAARLLAEHEADGRHQPGWPLIILTGESFQDPATDDGY